MRSTSSTRDDGGASSLGGRTEGDGSRLRGDGPMRCRAGEAAANAVHWDRQGPPWGSKRASARNRRVAVAMRAHTPPPRVTGPTLAHGGERGWRVRRATSSMSSVPARPGIYALGHDEGFEGLLIRRTYVYIGQSNDLRRRFQEHAMHKEAKPGLKLYLEENRDKAKFWFTTEVGESRRDLSRLESRLIRHFDPEFNVRK